jgi:protein transport protein SEC24
MCTFPNDVPPEYFAPIDVSGARIDRMQRPELMQGTVEFLVPKDYWNKEPVGLRTLFLIDVSQESIKRGFLKGVCKGIMKALYEEESSENTDESTSTRKLPEGSKIGIVTYDREVQFYNLSVRSYPGYYVENALTATRRNFNRHR